MKKETSADIVKRILKISFFLQLVTIILIYSFSKNIIYSIISLSGAIISVSGFLLMMRMIDRSLKKGIGQPLFFLAAFSKMVVIAGVFYLVSRKSETAVLLYLLGLLVIVVAIMTEALFRFCRSIFYGGT
jgi:hypothetical protein